MQTIISPLLVSHRLSLAPPVPRLLNNYHHRAPTSIRLSSHRSTNSLRLFSSTVAAAAAAAAASRDSEMATEDVQDPRIAKIASSIRVIPDFPKPGIMFQDITTLLLDTEAFKDTIALFVERYKDKDISVVAGVEARGFIFGPPIALAIGAKFVPMRKPKKLPGKVISEEYSLEYGTDKIEMHVGAVEPGERAIIIDDLIATGGTLAAAIRLLERVGVKIVECACVIELPELKGKDKLGETPLFVLVSSA
ncbi:PREDICTED: adenine phosphoribosyltransferase 1, chloroplastic isoform X2 [Camelina sativa]|uniref:adenine phosphoribosyltransferase n=1 Tax=Camelina sativa TaxID=90675 RepID=A0ABM0VSK0_CAMSA|nr:PREDICTED: adenine phosphoribosyltransferase 1, chloroplastic isoform X2 [Camelina sativa]